MKYILAILFLYSTPAYNQSYLYKYQNYIDYDNIESRYLKPTLDSNSHIIRTKHIITNKDTIKKYVDLEIINHDDRRIIRTYFDDGTLDEITITKLIKPNKLVEIHEFIDIEYFDRDSTFIIYNDQNLKIEEQTKYYEFDVIDFINNYKFYYNSNNKLIKEEFIDEFGEVARKDTFIYNERNRLVKSERTDCFGKLTSYKIFERDYWGIDEIQQIISYRSDSTIIQKIIPAKSRLTPDNTLVIKRYSKPWARGTYVVETREIETIQLDDKSSFQIRTRSFEDHKLKSETIEDYNSQNILIRKEYKYPNTINNTNVYYEYKKRQ